MKKLLSREQLFENFGNPILDPSIFGGVGNFSSPDPCNNNIVTPDGSSSVFQPCGDILQDPPAWATDDVIWKPGEKLVIGATILNGMPITPWGSMFAGTVQWNQKNVMTNAMWLDNVIKTVFPNGLSTSNKEKLDISLNKLTIIKMTPMSSGIGLNITLEFNLNDNVDLIAKFANWPNNFVCDPLNNLAKEDYIKIVGQIKNRIIEFLKPKAGIYTCVARELIVWTELGQVGRLHEGDKIEVIQSTEDKISFMWKDIKWIMKKPTYWWFNWHFIKH